MGGIMLSHSCGCGPTGYLPSIPVHGCDGRHEGWCDQDQGCRALRYLPGVQRDKNAIWHLGNDQEGEEGGVPGLAGTMSPSALGAHVRANFLQTSSYEPCSEVQSLFSWAKALKGWIIPSLKGCRLGLIWPSASRKG